MDQHATQTILDAVHNGGNSALLREWENKSEEEQIAACRQLVYGTTVPAIAEALGPENADAVQEVVAIFESLFKSVERNTQRSGTRTRAGSS